MLVLSSLALADAAARAAAVRTPATAAGARRGGRAAGSLVLIEAEAPALRCLTAFLNGAGCGLTCVAANVAMISGYGSRIGVSLLSFARMLATVTSIGPLVADAVIDGMGGVGPVFMVYAVLMPGKARALTAGPGAHVAADEPAG